MPATSEIDPLALVADLAAHPSNDPDEALQRLLGVLQEITTYATVLISAISAESSALRIHAVRNADPALTVPAGLEIPLTASPCQHVASSVAPFTSADMHADPDLATLPAAKDMGATSYIGVPVILPDGSFFGTLVGLDTAQKDQPREHIRWMQILAQLAALQLQRQLSRQLT